MDDASLEDLEQQRAHLYDGWPRPGTSGEARSARTTAAAGSLIACARNRITPATGRGICGPARWPGGAPRVGSCRPRSWIRCAPSWPTTTASREVTEQIVAVNEAICEARPPNTATTAPPAATGDEKDDM